MQLHTFPRAHLHRLTLFHSPNSPLYSLRLEPQLLEALAEQAGSKVMLELSTEPSISTVTLYSCHCGCRLEHVFSSVLFVKQLTKGWGLSQTLATAQGGLRLMPWGSLLPCLPDHRAGLVLLRQSELSTLRCD